MGFILEFLQLMTREHEVLGMDLTEVNFRTGAPSLQQDQQHVEDILSGVIANMAFPLHN